MAVGWPTEDGQTTSSVGKETLLGKDEHIVSRKDGWTYLEGTNKTRRTSGTGTLQ